MSDGKVVMIVRRIAAWLMVVGLLAVAPAAAAFKYVETGQKAPEFTAPDLSGAPVPSAPGPGDKAVAVVFWATWSPRSRAILDDLEKLYAEYRELGFRVVAVNVDHEHLDEETRRAVVQAAEAWSFPVVVDDGLAVYYAYGVVATPSVAVVDADGIVRFTRASYSTAAHLALREAVEGVLGVKPEAVARVAIKKRDYVPPKKATLHYQKAQILIRRGMAKKAVRDLAKAARLDPNWPEPRVLMARLYLGPARGKPGALEKAEAALREARKARPQHLQTLALLAEVLVARGNYDEALAVAGEALAIEPAYTPALLARARSFRALGRVAEAEADVAAALEVDPRNPRVFFEKGEVAAARGDWQNAADAFRKAVELALSERSRKG